MAIKIGDYTLFPFKKHVCLACQNRIWWTKSPPMLAFGHDPDTHEEWEKMYYFHNSCFKLMKEGIMHIQPENFNNGQ